MAGCQTITYCIFRYLYWNIFYPFLSCATSYHYFWKGIIICRKDKQLSVLMISVINVFKPSLWILWQKIFKEKPNEQQVAAWPVLKQIFNQVLKEKYVCFFIVFTIHTTTLWYSPKKFSLKSKIWEIFSFHPRSTFTLAVYPRAFACKRLFPPFLSSSQNSAC